MSQIGSVAWAADDEDSSGCKVGSTESLISGKGYRTFLAGMLNFKDFKYFFDDIFFLNRCHYQDVRNVQNRFDTVSKRIRSAFYKCEPDKMEDLKKEYYKLEAELSFLRVFLGDPDRRDFKMYFSAKKKEKFTIKDRDAVIKPKMKEYLVDKLKILDEKELDGLIDEFMKKYKNAPDLYAECKDQTWQALMEKIKEFGENWGGIQAAFEEAERQTKKREKAGKAAGWGDLWDNTKEAAKEVGHRMKNFYKPGNLVQLDISAEGLKETGQILKDYSDAYKFKEHGGDTPWEKYDKGPSPEAPAVSYQKLAELKDADEVRAFYEKLQVQMMMDYQSLYVSGGASVTSGLAAKLAQTEDKIKHMAEVVVPAVEDCHGYVKRQCE